MSASGRKHVVVLVSNSFIARYFLRCGDAIGYSRSGPRHVDLTDRKSVIDVLEREQPSVILNFATYGNMRRQDDADEIWRVNVLGTRNVLEALRRVAPDALYLHIGSYSEYGLSKAPMHENHSCAPVTPYGLAKLLATEMVVGYWRSYGSKGVVLRISSVYGPGEQPERLFPALFRAHRSGEPFQLWNGEVGRDFTWVGDVCEVLWRFVSHVGYGCFGEIINISRGHQVSIRETVETFQLVVGSLPIVKQERTPELADSPLWQGDIGKLVAVIGGFEFVDIAGGLLRWCREEA